MIAKAIILKILTYLLKKQNPLFKLKLAKYESGEVPKTLQTKIVNNALKNKFTPAQIHELLKPPPALCETGKRKGKPKFQRWAIFLVLPLIFL